MKKFVAIATAVILISGCGRKFTNEDSGSSNNTSNLDPNKFTTVKISKFNSSVLTGFTKLTLDLKCSGVLPGGKDWVEKGVVVTGSNSTFNLVSRTACTVTLQKYEDASQAFVPATPSKPLVLNISATGMGTLTNPAIAYSKNPPDANQWYFAANTTAAYAIVLNFGNDSETVVSNITETAMQQVKVVVGQGAPAPSITDITLSKTVNNSGGIDYSLYGNAFGFTACQIFPLNVFTTYDYNTVNNAFNGGTGTNCPATLLNGAQGNWNSNAVSGGIIVWENAVNGIQFNGYSYLIIKPNP